MAENYPEFIGKYKVSGIIAKGGMGVVYKAVHPSLKRYVVIKKMTARKNSSNVERFKREAQILLDLQSPYIVHLFDYFTEGGYRYMVEELVDGMALDKLIQKQVMLSPQLALLILQDACFALKYAHSKDIVHRDIKPGNILISKRAEIKLADFGIASDKEQNTEEGSLTQTGVALGTPAYMPPEQFENSAMVDKRADIYALGIMLYEMVTGAKPYPGTLSIETLNTIKKGKYISPKKLNKDVPPVVCKLIKKMLQPKASRRFQSTAPIIKIIKKYLKHYDTHAIRVQLAKLVLSGERVEEQVFLPKDLKLRKVRGIVLLAAGLLALFAGCWFTGLIQRYLLGHWLTPVSIEMIMPSSANSGGDLPVKAFFFENDGNKIPEVSGSRRILSFRSEKKLFPGASGKLEKEGGKTSGKSAGKNGGKASGAAASSPSSANLLSGNHRLFTAKDVFLKSGEYRVKVAAGPYVWWKSFEVKGKELTITCDFLKDMRRPLKVLPNVTDASTGRDISELSKISVWYGGSWQELSAVPEEKILNGTVWKFRFSAPGYEDEIFSLWFDWYQDELFLSAKLSKKK